MGRYDALTRLEEKNEAKTSPPSTPPPSIKNPSNVLPPEIENKQTNLPTNQQTSKITNQQTNLLANKQTSKEVNQQISKPTNQQTSENSLTTKEKKKYGTYLREDSILQIHIHAAQAQKKDHEIVQEIVDFYFKNLKTNLLVN